MQTKTWHERVVFSVIVVVILSIVTALLGNIYESYIIKHYANYKIKNADKRMQGCLYYKERKGNMFKSGLIPDYKSTYRKKVYYYTLNNQTVSMGYNENAKIDRLQYGNLVTSFLYRPHQCRHIEYILIRYFDGIFYRRKIYVYDILDEAPK
ncbi:hypothetical protein [Moraxella sp. ZY210820]|uniref:hypothetical protein n=1 Tax=unclassified Moraxella TaxID=2685852 RepID=UPI0027314445|nr:hypothetical protein [Moraxella sp. ZY210820]WLF84918.1 hypothetical protein LU301_05495 [Moraxella sp. ZY210820]